MGEDAGKAPSSAAEGYFECYADFSKTLRTWFIAYGVGAPVLLLSCDHIWTELESASGAHVIGWCFLIGAAVQVAEALLYKSAMWCLYRGEELPEVKKSRRYEVSFYVSEAWWLDVIPDVTSLALFGYATIRTMLILLSRDGGWV
jgi:hypothetical protein